MFADDCLYREPGEYAAPPPSVGVFDSPGIRLCLNTAWASHIDGVLNRLLCAAHWAGAEIEVETAVQEIQKLLVKLADVGTCEEEQPVSFPIGAGMEWYTDTPPEGWLLCQGQEVSRATYAALFAVIGIQFGDGDDETTFNLPDFRSRSPIGASATHAPEWSLGDKIGTETVTLTVQQIPAHDHYLPSGAGVTVGGSNRLLGSPVGAVNKTGSTGDSQPHSNIGPSLVINFIIYAGV